MAKRTGYLLGTRHPWPCLLFVLPLLAAYEGGVHLLGGAHPESLRNGADNWLRGALAAAGLACVDVRGNRAGGEAEPWLDELSHTKALYIARQEAPDRDEGR
jgi:hypothetical protein